ncbi:MAG: DUF898 domain-containing protein [bacterium]|nr:DUF898 domain-containing protein [bacterium]
MHDDLNPPDAGLPEPAPEAEARPAAEPVTAGFVFTGTTDEYFRIWIVNMCLSLVTLGIYSAWAKVRLTQYIRAHTTLDGMPFTYDANPMAILRGRIVAVVVFGGWTALGYVAPLAQLALLLPLAFVVPWLIVASLRFNARVTTYRNVGFTFDGRYGDALGYFVVAPVLSVFTLYLLIPWVVCRQRVWQAAHTSWGDRRLAMRGVSADFYVAHLPVIMAVVVAIVLFSVAIGMSTIGEEGESPLPSSSTPAMYTLVLVYLIVIFASIFTHAAVLKATLGNLWIGEGARVNCRLETPRYAWILISNTLATLVSLGLLYPWSEIRRLRYLAAHTSVTGVETFDTVTGPRGAAGSAAGEEIADAFDIEVGF